MSITGSRESYWGDRSTKRLALDQSLMVITRIFQPQVCRLLGTCSFAVSSQTRVSLWIFGRKIFEKNGRNPIMRSDIVPGAIFPDYELPDHTGTRCKLSELQGDDPLILTLARGHYCPKEHQQHLELAAFYPKIAVAYTQIATISTDDHHRRSPHSGGIPCVSRSPVDIPFGPRPNGSEGSRHPGVHRPRAQSDDPAYARAQAGPRDPQYL